MQKTKNTFRIISVGVIVGIVVLVFLGACVKNNGNNTSTVPNDDEVNSHLITGWGAEKGDIPIPPVFSEWLKKNKVGMVQYIFKNGTIIISDISGKEIETCGKIEDGRVVNEKCENFNGVDIEQLAEETTLRTNKNPNCITKKIGGYLIQVCH